MLYQIIFVNLYEINRKNKRMIQYLYKFLLDVLRKHPFFDDIAKPLAVIVSLIAMIILAGIAYYIARFLIVKFGRKIAQKTKTKWDDILVDRKVFHSLAHLAPALVIYYSSGFASPDLKSLADATPEILSRINDDYYVHLVEFILNVVKIYFIIIAIYFTNTFLNAVNDIYQSSPLYSNRSIKGYIQLIKIFIFFICGILIISILIDKNPTILIGGLGAMAAVLMLVFKDTILGFVASIQLSGNNMLKIGDWIEMPSHKADGDVIDITLNTVKVQNWDKTITTIPTYALVSESFTNWKGMKEAGGRRIKRSVYIDVNTIKFCDAEMLQRFQKFEIIKDYVIGKEKEIREFNKKYNLSDEDISGRRQTNVGVFRKYLEVYLRYNPHIHQQMTFLVRQLQPTDKGLPIEIYVFTNDTVWANYENIQSDIFDHVFAVLPGFELKAFQTPSGNDIRTLADKIIPTVENEKNDTKSDN